MSKPNLIIDVLPSLNGKAYYLPLGPKSSNDIERLKIALRLKITNDDPDHDPITIVGITFSFPGTDLGIRTMFKEQKYIDPEGGELALGETATWSNGSVCLVDTTNGCPGEEKRFNQVYLDTPAPEEIKINVHCEEFTEPASKTVDLIPWEDPTGDGPLILPFAANNLDDDEYIVTSARHWYNGGSNGTQIFAHDMSIQAQVDNEWTSVRAGSDPDNLANEDIRVFGRPIRAMADGEVFKVEDIFADNPYGTELTDSTYGTKLRLGKIW